MKNSPLILYWIVRIVASVVMLQTLYFKFSGSSESVYIFSTIGMEPWGRIGVGIMELIGAVLLLFNSTAWIGAALALGLMAGALGMHLTLLGIEVQGDGGYLFFLALLVTVCSMVVLIVNKKTIVDFLFRYFKR